MFLVRLLLASIIMTVCFATFASGAYKLPGDEVEALRDIFNSLGKDWDFSNPCSRDVTTLTAGLKIYAAVNCSNSCEHGEAEEDFAHGPNPP
ncbi:hypothetical protein I3760_10G025900 [Carya illinoinensis]|nr:hypothetical protein I3760_10G025900 [Carya illinoinensis]